MELKYFIVAVLLVEAVYGASMPPLQELHLSSPRKAVSAAEADSKLYLIGGFEYHSSAASTKIDVFDITTNSWNSTIDLLSPRGFVSPVVIEPRIYCIGGYDLVNTPYIYSTAKRDLVPLPPGPTVRSHPNSMSMHNSILTVVGDFSVDFFDLQNNQSTFYPELTSFMLQLYQSDAFSYQDLVFVIGGENTTTHEDIYSTAWIFNTTSRTLTEYSNITSKDRPAVFTVSVSENVVVVTYTAIPLLLMYHLKQDRWVEETAVQYPLTPVTVNDVTHMFGTIYKSYNWLTGETKVSNDNIWAGFAFLGDIIYVTKASPPALVIISSGVTNTYPNRGVQLYDYPMFSAPWNSRQYIFSDGGNIYVFDAVNKNITTLSGFNRVSSIFILNATTFVMFDANVVSTQVTASTMKTYNSNLVLIGTSSLAVPIAPQYIVGDDFVDIFSGKSAKVSDIQNVVNLTARFQPQGEATSQSGDVFAVMLTDVLALEDVTIPQYQHYKKIDVYNYNTNQWEDSIDLPEELTTEPLNNFAVAAALNDKILVWYKSGCGYYDLATKNWTIFTENVTYSTDLYGNRFNVPLQVFMTTPVFDDRAFIPYPLLDRYLVMNYTTMDQPSTTAAFVTDGGPHAIRQRVQYNDLIYAAFFANSDGGYDGLSYYEPATDTWQIFYFGSSFDFINIASFGTDTMLIFDGNQTVRVYNTTTGVLAPYDLDFPFKPAVSIQAGHATVVAGGEHLNYNFYTDRVLVFAAPVIVPPTPPLGSDTPQASLAPSGLSDGELIAAIVVPIVAALLIAGLVVFLVIFLKKRKRRRSTTTVGLEQRFGEWFTPFKDIQFAEKLGQGANGQVFKGKWKNTDVALKVSMTQAEQSVISELSLMINLRPHPNVVQLFGFSVHPETNNVILILEFCNGGSLDVMLYDADKSIPLEQKTAWLQGIGRGIAHLHANNIVHRDLAARNVLIHHGEPKLTDFGMSRLVDEQQQRGTTKSDLGPIRWMAPESLKHKQYSTKSDVWTFGILMYEVIVQQEPHFEANDAILIGTLIRDEGLTPRVPPPPLCPSEFASLMRLCWALKPDQRPTIETVLLQLENMK